MQEPRLDLRRQVFVGGGGIFLNKLRTHAADKRAARVGADSHRAPIRTAARRAHTYRHRILNALESIRPLLLVAVHDRKHEPHLREQVSGNVARADRAKWEQD